MLRRYRQALQYYSMKRLIFVVFCLCLIAETAALGQSNSPQHVLKKIFEEKVERLIDSTDAVIGVTVRDLITGENFSFNGDLVFTQASAIKLQILVELFNQAKQGKIALDEPMKLNKRDIVPGSGVLQRLTPGKVSMTTRDVAILMVIVSDNTATNMIIDLVGMENVNRTLGKLGFSQTKLQRKMMDTKAWMADRENISTPNETARLLEMIYKGEVLDRESCDEILRILSIPKTGRIRMYLPRGTRVAHKTGTVSGVVSDVGIVYLKNRPFIVSAMVNWIGERDAGEYAIARIALAAYQYFDRLANSNRYGHKK